jgi:hypothetical protein
LHNQVLVTLEKLDNETQGNKTRAAELVLRNVTEENLVTVDEAQDLEMILQLMNDNQITPSDLINRFSSIRNQLIEENASPLAIAISSVALSSTQYWYDKYLRDFGPISPIEQCNADCKRYIRIAIADVEGALIGWETGLKFGGLWGAGIGAVLVGALDSYANSRIAFGPTATNATSTIDTNVTEEDIGPSTNQTATEMEGPGEPLKGLNLTGLNIFGNETQ